MNINNLHHILNTFGFEPNEITIYITLLEYGRLPARRVASLAKIPRVTTYQNLQKLITKGIALKYSDKKIDMFEGVSPSVLNSILSLKMQETESHRFGFERILPDLLSVYARGMRRPSVIFYEGVDGFINIYNDILSSGYDLDIVASTKKVPEYQAIIQKYKKKQEKMGIKVRALVPRSNDVVNRSRQLPKNPNIKAVLDEDLPLNGQLLIYGDKVAITHFSGDVSHVLIENKYIAQMFKQIFVFMWNEYRKALV